ncbi:MAG: hypothetical protein KF833_15340 [Verrucomicrobiae bacterium]|nr:hypothetical protein [Verrucomicrobiae bacterium]
MGRRLLLLALVVLAPVRPASAGSVVRLYYDNLSVSSSPTIFRIGLASLTNSTRFPDQPSFREQLDDFTALPGSPLRAGLQGKDNSGNDFGSYIRGYIEAPVTGEYLFNVASDDNSALLLSTDHTEANKRTIAFETESGAPLFGGPRQDQRLSAPISLVRGRKYYFEVLHKQAGGSSYIQVGWQRPDGVQEIVPALHLAQYPIDPFLGTGQTDLAPVFNVRGREGGNLPASVSLEEGSALLLELDVVAAQPTVFRWTIDGEVIPDENLSFLSIPRVPATLHGKRIAARVENAFGSLDSAVATLSVKPDTTRPSVIGVETGGNPNLLRITYSEPVEPASALDVANYEVRSVGGDTLTVGSAVSVSGDRVVELSGAFGFRAGVDYHVTVRNVRDRATAPNPIAPDPTTVAFVFSAPIGTTYTFDGGRPSGFRFFGSADVISTGSHDGSGFLQLTDAFRNRNGAVLLEERRDVDQVRIRFKARFGDGDSTSGLDLPGDGMSVNVAGDLPLGTLTAPEEGFAPDVPGDRIAFTFDTHPDSSIDPVAFGVVFNNQVLTNVLAGTNGLTLNGIPPITRLDGRWVDVDIDLRRNGLLTLRFDGVTILDEFPTPFEIVRNAQIGLAARTRSWFQTHWIDDLNINYGEGDIGDVGLSSDSILGGEFPEGSEVRLEALPVGAGPFVYEWVRNGVAIPNESSRILRFPATAGAGGQFSVRVRNAFSEFTSEPRSVSVLADLQPPELIAIRGLAGGVNRIELTFDEPLDPVTATDPATYSSPLLRVGSATLGADGRTVVLETTPQRVGITYPVVIRGLRDRAVAGNSLNTDVSFVSAITYRDEVLADQPTRFFRFEETSGTVAFTEAVAGDRANTNGTYINLPILGVPSLVPSATGEFAVHLVGAQTNYIAVPNGGDINDFRGPWAKKTVEFWFRAHSVPPPGATSLPHNTAGLYEEGGGQRSIHLHLWRDPAKSNPAESELVFHAFNDGPDGPGAPFGIRQFDPVYVTHTIRTNVTYHVVGVFDGRTDSLDGELRLYIDSELVARSTNGVGQIYNHNGDVRIGSGSARTFFNVSAAFGPLDGIIDDLSLYNTVLSEERIRARYLAGIGASLAATNPPTIIESVDPRGHPRRVNVVFNQPVGPQSANRVENYSLRTDQGTVLAIGSAQLQDDLVTVRLDGPFDFAAGGRYELTVQDVADILAPENVVVPTTVAFSFASEGPVAIGTGSDLGARQIVENQTARFSVVPAGQPPFTFQWTRNGVPLEGENGSALEFEATIASAGEYSVVVSNEFSFVVGPPASLTVVPDIVAPALVGVRGLSGSLNQVRLRFSEPLDPLTAANPATYRIAGLNLVEAVLSADGREVVLETSPQTHGTRYSVSVEGLRDRAFIPNALTTTASFVSAVSYRDEILAENPVRYWPLNETSGGNFFTLVSRFDQVPENLVGIITNGPTLGVPSLVSNLPTDTAIGFRGDSLNYLHLPNGRDINALLGPWAKRTHLFHFRADSLPRITDGTNVAAPAIFGHDRIGIYLYGTQDTNAPTEALLVFTAHNSVSEGPASPWGALSGNPDTAKFVSVPVQAGRVYHVAAVLDGSATTFTGQLRLYLDGELVGVVGGIGQIYKHPNTRIGLGSAPFRRHDGINTSIDPSSANRNESLDGVIDEFVIIDRALSAARIAELHRLAQIPPPEDNGSGPPRITSVGIQAGNVVVAWEGPGQLQRSDAPDGPFVTVPGATNPHTEPVDAARRFYRIAR